MTGQSNTLTHDLSQERNNHQLLIVQVNQQPFGIPVLQIRDIFKPSNLTPVPLSSPEILGVANLRGRIVTTIDLRTILNLSPRESGTKIMMVAVEHDGELYSLVADEVHEVMNLSSDDMEENPTTLDDRLKSISQGIYKLDKTLLCVLDIHKILGISGDNHYGEGS